ncbi:MAG: glycoside hydrolase family 43 protein, partial [Firmicutes bacterium]|nr:glycoside hydrolase family 43 protein [Bacillota bacterium]
GDTVSLKVEAQFQDINFYGNGKLLAEHVDGRLLSKEIAGGFTGTILGLYASSNGSKSSNYADFKSIHYQGLKD